MQPPGSPPSGRLPPPATLPRNVARPHPMHAPHQGANQDAVRAMESGDWTAFDPDRGPLDPTASSYGASIAVIGKRHSFASIAQVRAARDASWAASASVRTA